MALTRRSTTSTTKGLSLSRGPALLLGSLLLAAGLYFLYHAHTFPALSRFPSGHARTDGRAFFHIFGVNGWSAELTAVAGGLLLFCAAQHILAKTASLIVGIVLAGVAIIALVDHHTALGLFAVNIWTIVLWGAVAVLLLINVLLPRPTVTATPAATVVTPAAPVYAPAPVEPVTAAYEPATASYEPATTPLEPATETHEPATASYEPATVPLEPATGADEPATTPLEPATVGRMGPIRTEPVTGSSARSSAGPSDPA